MQEKFPAGHTGINAAFEGRRATVTAQKLKPGWVKELAKDLPTVRVLDKAIKCIIKHYTVENTSLDKVMTTRSQLFGNIGKLALRVGEKLEQAAGKAAALGKPLTPDKTREVSASVMKGQLSLIEDKYRAKMVEAFGCSDSNWPKSIYPPEADASTIKCDDVADQSLITVSGLLQGGDSVGHDQEVHITEAIVLRRLNIDALPAEVSLANLDFLLEDRH